MKRVLRICAYSLIVLIALAGALFGYFVYTPEPEVPRLSGTLSSDSLDVGGLHRTYLRYVPSGLPKGAPLVVVLHGSGESAVQIRRETGYAFERLADTHHFAVVYPNADRSAGRDWNACGTVGETSANKRPVDDVGFLTGLVDKCVADIGIDPGRVFAAGSSRGGFMAFRLALEAPSTFRAVAAVAANVHTTDNFKCKRLPDGTSSVLIMNGTKDPLVPFHGGEVSLLRFSYKYGKVMSSQESGQYFADLNHIAGEPQRSETTVADGVRVKRITWHNGSKAEVELVAIEGGGHGMPQPYRRHPRLLGPSPKEPNGPDAIWAFFDRQRR